MILGRLKLNQPGLACFKAHMFGAKMTLSYLQYELGMCYSHIDHIKAMPGFYPKRPMTLTPDILHKAIDAGVDVAHLCWKLSHKVYSAANEEYDYAAHNHLYDIKESLDNTDTYHMMLESYRDQGDIDPEQYELYASFVCGMPEGNPWDSNVSKEGRRAWRHYQKMTVVKFIKIWKRLEKANEKELLNVK